MHGIRFPVNTDSQISLAGPAVMWYSVPYAVGNANRWHKGMIMVHSSNRQMVFRPALLPDNRRLVWYPVVTCCALAALGYVVNSIPLTVCPLLVIAVFPGLSIAFHGIYFLSVRITLAEDEITVVDLAGDPFVTYPRIQRIAPSRVAFAYHLSAEAGAQQAGALPQAPFEPTCIRMDKYRKADDDPRRVGAVARSDNGLVLSNTDGTEKMYIMHFHDLAKLEWQTLARSLRAQNPGIEFLMTQKEQTGLFGSEA